MQKLDEFHTRITDKQAKILVGDGKLPHPKFRRWIKVNERGTYGWLLRQPCAAVKRGWVWCIALPRGAAA